ncbi:hypothetical protein OKA05_15975 [Luteolibacter arcticus]|uniref:DUF481 domain-containing protein n=1 Tax=Luteolibacter arcticus TaxID=1581411 RepID=A0ABT3GKS1_9BACT|nr:hypothetical protein [Luteolibacter arcticus]MCW1924066.1 hypothetical protein [Luteolibacter arcticus]
MKMTLPSFRSPTSRLAVLAWAGCLAMPCHAQSAALIDQARMRSALLDVQPGMLDEDKDGDGVPDNVEGEAVATPGDLDLGVQLIMKEQERAHLLRLFATSQVYFTDNVRLTNFNPESDAYLFTEVGARYEGKLTEQWNVEATVRQAFFRYDDFSNLDFESLNAGAGISYRLPQDPSLMFFSRYNCERLTADDLDDQFFLNQTVSLGLQKSWVTPASSLYYLGYASSFGFADPSAAERDEHGLYGGARWQLTECLHADLYSRFAFFDYDSGQHDWNYMIVPSLTYRFNEWCELNASLSFVLNRSNRDLFDYDALSAGGGLGLKVQF